jgi:hypothetical protein
MTGGATRGPTIALQRSFKADYCQSMAAKAVTGSLEKEALLKLAADWLALLRRPSSRQCHLRQLIVFALKGFVENLVDFWIERSSVAMIAHADRYHNAAVYIAFVAPLPKIHCFHGFDDFPPFAEFADNELVLGGHCPVPRTVAHSQLICMVSFGNV